MTTHRSVDCLPHEPGNCRVSVVIPTYRRGNVLLRAVSQLSRLECPPSEILVVDQTPCYEACIERRLNDLSARGMIKWMRLSRPSIPLAMNQGVLAAQGEIILFLDDDVELTSELVAEHVREYTDPGVYFVVGQIIQPWEAALPVGSEVYEGGKTDDPDAFRFNSSERRWIRRVMAGNLSVRRSSMLDVGGFDENFVHAAYRFEAEFAERVLAKGYRILFSPKASLRHLRVDSGGTRSYGFHLRSLKPSHAVGDYYYLLTSRQVPKRFRRILGRPFRAIRTRHHFRRPWWIPVTWFAEFSGFLWAILLAFRGKRLLRMDEEKPWKG